jgi:hypothetical protein
VIVAESNRAAGWIEERTPALGRKKNGLPRSVKTAGRSMPNVKLARRSCGFFRFNLDRHHGHMRFTVCFLRHLFDSILPALPSVFS